MAPSYDDSNAYKLAKEAWVSNCTGGSIVEIALVVSTIVTSHELWASLAHSKRINAQSFWIQYAIYILPVLGAQTVLANHALLVNLGLLFLNFLVVCASQNKETARPSDGNAVQKAYLTVYRAGIMLLTCIAILAVDFPIFPRRFAKVETFGTSLMDVGVGSFVFSSGIVAARSVLFTHSQKSFQQAATSAIRSSIPLLVLGLTRVILTKGVDYQEHHSEYGLHWNFFFTLGFLPPFVALFMPLYRLIPFSAMGLALATGYQWALARGLQDWILSAPRADLVTANKEGLCSFIGYLSIFLLGLDGGLIVFRKHSDLSLTSRWLGLNRATNTRRTSVQLTIRAIGLWCAFGLWNVTTQDKYDGYEVSRRMANLPYVLWVVAFNFALLASLAWIESRHADSGRGPSMLWAINKLGLETFLVANLLTGLINLNIRTLYASTFVGLSICLGYMAIVARVPFAVAQKTNLTLAAYLSGKR